MSVTDADGKYSLLDVPSELPLTLFVIKNEVIIGTAPIQLEKWKEKSLDIYGYLQSSSCSRRCQFGTY